MKEYFNQSWIIYWNTKSLIILALILRFCLCTLWKYSLSVYYQLITFPSINVICYLCIVFIKLLLLPLYCQDLISTVPSVFLNSGMSATAVCMWPNSSLHQSPVKLYTDRLQ